MSSAANQTGDGDTHHLHHEWTGAEPVSEKVVAAVAEYEDTDADALPPLADAVDPTSLDSLFGSTSDDACTAGCVTFSYFGYTVLAQSTGQIIIKKR